MSDFPRSLFAYGSLQLGNVFEAVTRQSLTGAPATLEGFQRTKLKGFGFPAIIPASGMQTPGLIYSGLLEEAWHRLDAFEDDFYERLRVIIHLANGEWIEADTYVLAKHCHHLSMNEPWSLDDLDPETIQTLLARL